MVDVIYGKLKNDIIELVYKPDEHLVESALAEELGVSRTPLRQALYRLELEGLIIKKLNGRMNVGNVSIKEATELFLVREVIEGLIAREASLKIAQDKDFHLIIDKLENIMYYMHVSAEANRRTEVVKYGSRFHSFLESYSNNVTASNILNQINVRVSRYRRLGAYRDPSYSFLAPVEEHEEILKHLKEKDGMSAEIAMRNHIKRSLKSTIAALAYKEYFH